MLCDNWLPRIIYWKTIKLWCYRHCWSNYKNHYTVEYLVCITPNENTSLFLIHMEGEQAINLLFKIFKSFTTWWPHYGRQGFYTWHCSILSMFSDNTSIKTSKYTNVKKWYQSNFKNSKCLNICWTSNQTDEGFSYIKKWNTNCFTLIAFSCRFV